MQNFRDCLAKFNSQEIYDEWLNSGFFTIVRNDAETEHRLRYSVSHHAHKTAHFIYALNNNLHRTFRRALSTVGTLLVVDDRHIIIHVDRIELTLLRT